jgi:hypothetical protein
MNDKINLFFFSIQPQPNVNETATSVLSSDNATAGSPYHSASYFCLAKDFLLLKLKAAG